MIVYRIEKARHAGDLTGEGARLYGGRWNHKLTACIYTSESRALALLEYSVNVCIEDIPRSLVITTLEVPGNILLLNSKELPKGWHTFPAPAAAKDYGTGLLIKATHPVIQLPSAIIPGEFNYILNPLHRDSAKFKVLDISAFTYDVRIKM
ncbi:MAG: hypothetical protein K0Q79_505 [Flavipsychrobacter sp.]|jgi:RES domain-containing protein|nr:hypothetical protein [Flavipsychrobacter sp.]